MPDPPPRKHILDYLDFGWKVSIAIIGAWFAYNKDASDKRLFHEEQLRNTSMAIRQIDDQKKTSDKQLVASFMPRFKCDSSTLRSLEFHYLDAVSPEQATNVSNAIGKCGLRPEDRKEAEVSSAQSALRELDRQFLDQLSGARRYRNAGLQNRAASEYEEAYNRLPASRRRGLDESIAAKARQALDNRDFPRASDLFEQFFALIGTS
jgi:hypothetical protein